jgi:hypothetical protein
MMGRGIGPKPFINSSYLPANFDFSYHFSSNKFMLCFVFILDPPVKLIRYSTNRVIHKY